MTKTQREKAEENRQETETGRDTPWSPGTAYAQPLLWSSPLSTASPHYYRDDFLYTRAQRDRHLMNYNPCTGAF